MYIFIKLSLGIMGDKINKAMPAVIDPPTFRPLCHARHKQGLFPVPTCTHLCNVFLFLPN